MFFDTSFIYELQNAVFQIQKMMLGGLVLIFLFSMLRFALWALFSLSMGRFANLAASVVTYGLAFLVFATPGLRETAISYGYGLACSLSGGNIASGNLPGLGGVENMVGGALDDMMNQIRSAFPF